LTQEFQSASGPVVFGTPSVRYTYSDASTADNSRLTGIVYPDGYTVNYNYSSGLNDAISRVSSLSDSIDPSTALQSFTYQGLDTVMGTSEPGPSVTQTTTLDQFGRIQNMTWTNSSSTTLAEYSYTYDDDSDVLSRTDGVNSGFSQTYSYNNLNEVTGYDEGTISGGTLSSPTASQSLDYDALGNVTSNTVDGGTAQTRSANAQNEYTSISGATTPTYDNNGNMTTDSAGLIYVYDAWNRVVKIENSAGTSTLETFAYDGLGRRIFETAGDTTTNLFYSAAGQVLEESSGGDFTNRYVWSPVYVNALVLRDSLVSDSPSERLWVIQDANWNVVALVNNSGTVVKRYDYTPFGQVTALNSDGTAWSGSSEYDNWVYLSQGGRLDAVTGNYQFGARDYNPALERWTTNDPLGLAAGDPNTYRTEGNDVTSAVDPTGFESTAELSIILGGPIVDDQSNAVSTRPLGIPGPPSIESLESQLERARDLQSILDNWEPNRFLNLADGDLEDLAKFAVAQFLRVGLEIIRLKAINPNDPDIAALEASNDRLIGILEEIRGQQAARDLLRNGGI